MKKRTVAMLFATHCAVGIAGFGLGVYALPILIAPPAPGETDVKAASARAGYTARFQRNLKGSDALHWGEGTVSVGTGFVAFMGRLAPGPDYKLYFSPEFVETEADFNRLKPTMVRAGDIRTFKNFIVDIPRSIDPADYTSVIVWCESFGQFITSAKYR
jgi:hypothetical protein